jgi:hypothetical protein
MVQWRVLDDKGNKVKSQEVLEMPRWCIHPFSTLGFTLALLDVHIHTEPVCRHCICCSGLADAVWLCNSSAHSMQIRITGHSS